MALDLTEHALAHPPRCLGAFRADPGSGLLRELAAPDHWARFGLRCPCGSVYVKILGRSITGEVAGPRLLLGAPLCLDCTQCGDVAEVMNPETDGYDAELGYSSVTAPEDALSLFRCPKCQHDVMETAAAFEYSIGEEDLRSDPELASRPQDFFTWFGLYARCQSCGAVHDVAQYECA